MLSEAATSKLLTQHSENSELARNHWYLCTQHQLGEYIIALPDEQHMIYFLQTDAEIIIIQILS